MMNVGIGKIQFHDFSLEAKNSNCKVSDKIKKLANTLIMLKNSSDIMMTSSIVKEESENIRHLECAILN